MHGQISYKMQVNLNQLAKLANIHGLLFVTDAIREYISRTNEYFKTGTWCEMDLSAYESEQKQREQLAAKVRELQKKNAELQKAATNYYLYTAEGECLFCERHNCRIYPDNRYIYWHFKVADYPTCTLPTEISREYLNREILIWDMYWHKILEKSVDCSAKLQSTDFSVKMEYYWIGSFFQLEPPNSLYWIS